MIKLIYGEKGTGKTKQIIDEANVSAETCGGAVMFITDSQKYIFSLSHKIRLIDSNEYDIKTQLGLLGFISGLIAGNNDTQYVYVDGAARMTGETIADMEVFYNELETIADKCNVKIVLTVSCAESLLPQYMKRFI